MMAPKNMVEGAYILIYLGLQLDRGVERWTVKGLFEWVAQIDGEILC